MTTFKYALSICGLSQQEAADFLDVRLSTIKDWSAGRYAPPKGVWEQIAALFDEILNAAEDAAEIMNLDGIPPQAFNNIEAITRFEPLPAQGSTNAAGAMALLLNIQKCLEQEDIIASNDD